jgi:hypothetical protein
MNTGGWTLAHGAGYAPYYGTLTYRPNGTSNPDLALVDGTLKRFVTSITYAATGKQSIVFTPDFVFPKTVVWTVTAGFDAIANAYSVGILLWTPTTRTLELQQHIGVSGVAAASNPANVVRLLAHVNNSAGA